MHTRALLLALLTIVAAVAGCVEKRSVGDEGDDEPSERTTPAGTTAGTPPPPNPTTDPEVVAELDSRVEDIVDALSVAGELTDLEDWDGARAELAGASSDVRRMNGYLLRHDDDLTPEDFHLYEVSVELLDLLVETTDQTLLWTAVTTENAARYDAAPFGSAEEEYALRSLEGTRADGARAVELLYDLAGEIDRLLAEEPEIAAEFGFSHSDAETFRSSAGQLINVMSQVDAFVAEARAAGTYVEPEPIAPGGGGSLPAAGADLVSAELAALFDSFDQNGDEQVDRDEAEAFYFWVEDHITYRYDDENAVDTFPGLLVGDGRPGPDFTQTPTETFVEGYGDCEDMNRLEVAFYNHWGIEAYQAYVNAQTQGYIDHAIAIVKVGATLEEAQAVMGYLDHYEFYDGDGWGIGAGIYAIVDNAYSDDYGFISNGIPPGQFDIFEIRDLTEQFSVNVY